jgi:hypothetical protein
MRRSLLLAALALAGCQEAAAPHVIPLHGTEVLADEPARAPGIVSLAHGGEQGPIPVNTELDLVVTATDPAGQGLVYTWSANGGSVEGKGARAVWRTPPEAGVYALTVKVSTPSGASAQTRVNVAVSNTISGDVVSLQGNGAPVTVESGRDQIGTWCSIDVDANRRPHISYFNRTHAQTRYAHWNGTQWVLRIVDGPGFNTGRPTGEVSLVKVGADGHPRVAYQAASGGIHFAQWNGTTWLRSGAAIDQGMPTSLALDPSRQDEPAFVYAKTLVSAGGPAEYAYQFARRADGAWSTQTLLSVTSARCPYQRGMSPGTLAFGADGTAYTVAWPHCLGDTYYDSPSGRYVYPYSGGLAYLERNPTTGVWATDYIVGTGSMVNGEYYVSGSSNLPPRMVRSATGAFAVAAVGTTVDRVSLQPRNEAGLFFRAPGTTTWQSSFVDANLSRFDVGLTPDNKPLLTTGHGGLELVSTDPLGFWTYTYVGSVDFDSSPLALAVDSGGQPHLCYSLGGSLRYF